MNALGPEDRRLVIALDEDERLAGTAVVRGDGPDEVTIALQPWAEVTGRFVDEEGEPITGLYLIADDEVFDQPEAVEVGSIPRPIELEDDGRFRIVGLLPGLTYSFRLTTVRDPVAEPITGLTVEAGETKDLGDLTSCCPSERARRASPTTGIIPGIGRPTTGIQQCAAGRYDAAGPGPPRRFGGAGGPIGGQGRWPGSGGS